MMVLCEHRKQTFFEIKLFCRKNIDFSTKIINLDWFLMFSKQEAFTELHCENTKFDSLCKQYNYVSDTFKRTMLKIDDIKICNKI